MVGRLLSKKTWEGWKWRPLKPLTLNAGATQELQSPSKLRSHAWCGGTPRDITGTLGLPWLPSLKWTGVSSLDSVLQHPGWGSCFSPKSSKEVNTKEHLTPGASKNTVPDFSRSYWRERGKTENFSETSKNVLWGISPLPGGAVDLGLAGIQHSLI